MSLSTEGYYRIVYELAESLILSGFRKIFIVGWFKREEKEQEAPLQLNEHRDCQRAERDSPVGGA
jgi:hypothetical protein